MRKSFYLWWLFLVAIVGSARAECQSKEEALILLAQDSLAKAEMGFSPLPEEVYAIQGMTSRKIQSLLNYLCSAPYANYFEIGCWQGATLIGALYGNKTPAVGIDNFSQIFGDGNERQYFYSNVRRFIPNANLAFYEVDCFSFDKSLFQDKINVYFYDGHHGGDSQEYAFTYFDEIFDDVFIALVDDWNWGSVQEGTRAAFQKLNYKVLFEREFFTTTNGDRATWWNGLYIAVVRKNI